MAQRRRSGKPATDRRAGPTHPASGLCRIWGALVGSVLNMAAVGTTGAGVLLALTVARKLT